MPTPIDFLPHKFEIIVRIDRSRRKYLLFSCHSHATGRPRVQWNNARHAPGAAGVPCARLACIAHLLCATPVPTPSNSMISFMIIVLDMAWSYCLSVARLIRSTRVSPLIDRSFISVLDECLVFTVPLYLAAKD